jgi:hypothetical protein
MVRKAEQVLEWRVIYRVVPDRLTYYIESITAHDYRRQ